MKHVVSVSRIPALAGDDLTDLQPLIDALSLFLSLLGTFTSAAQTLFSGVVSALGSKDSSKN
ncbi:MAG: hypothetical protein JXR94_09445 [Candidatus Hydrogenedentes bacterium]|nr:hypothetical protein [Candidatus Hydrogenedentota bacterium]